MHGDVVTVGSEGWVGGPIVTAFNRGEPLKDVIQTLLRLLSSGDLALHLFLRGRQFLSLLFHTVLKVVAGFLQFLFRTVVRADLVLELFVCHRQLGSLPLKFFTRLFSFGGLVLELLIRSR